MSWVRFKAKLWDFSKEKDNVALDLLEFIEEYKSNLNKIKEVFKPKDDEELKQIALNVHNAYTQKVMAKYSWAMSLLTGALVLTSFVALVLDLKGEEYANNLVTSLINLAYLIIVIIFSLIFLGLILKCIKWVIRWCIARQKHIWCSNCNRIIHEYELEGDIKSAMTTCPNCINKKLISDISKL